MCDCIEKTNAFLKDQGNGNTMLLTNLFGPPRAVVSTCKRSERVRGKPFIMMASFCPFCGEEYELRKSEAA